MAPEGPVTMGGLLPVPPVPVPVPGRSIREYSTTNPMCGRVLDTEKKVKVTFLVLLMMPRLPPGNVSPQNLGNR